jgi:hypothetical protein
MFETLKNISPLRVSEKVGVFAPSAPLRYPQGAKCFMGLDRIDKIANSLCNGLYRRLQLPIEKLLAANPEMKPHAQVALDSFLFKVRRKAENIQSYVNDNERTKDCVVTDKSGSLIFTFTIRPNLTSTCEIQLITAASIEIPNQFIDSRVFPAKGYVYFIKSEFGYKIGCARHLYKRLKIFEVKLPFKVTLHSYIYCKQFCEFERELHKLMSHKNIDGEWFNLTEDDFIELDKYVSNTHRRREIAVEGAVLYDR